MNLFFFNLGRSLLVNKSRPAVEWGPEEREGHCLKDTLLRGRGPSTLGLQGLNSCSQGSKALISLSIVLPFTLAQQKSIEPTVYTVASQGPGRSQQTRQTGTPAMAGCGGVFLNRLLGPGQPRPHPAYSMPGTQESRATQVPAAPSGDMPTSPRNTGPSFTDLSPCRRAAFGVAGAGQQGPRFSRAGLRGSRV